MARALSAYNHHVSQYIRSHPTMRKADAMRAAAAAWSGRTTKRSNPSLSMPSIGGNTDLLKWGLIAAAAIYLWPKLSKMGQPPVDTGENRYQMPPTGL